MNNLNRNKNRKRNKKEKSKIKNEKFCGSHIESGFLDNDNLTESDIYGAINELHAYISLENESFDFGDGLLTPSNNTTESAYIEFGLNILYSYVGYDYSEREYLEVLFKEMGLNHSHELDCPCIICDIDSYLIKNETDKIDYINRNR